MPHPPSDRPRLTRSVREASQLIESARRSWGTEEVPLPRALGRVLAEPLRADRDFPPFDRVAMDGIAIARARYLAGQRRFAIAGMQPAGAPPLPLPAGACLEVMTGAVLPAEADAVIPYEKVVLQGGQAILPDDLAIKPHANVQARARNQRAGDELVPAGRLLTGAETGLAAAVGQSRLRVARLPRTALIGTGDELVDPDRTPAPHQVRMSNVYALADLLRPLRVEAGIYHLPDRRAASVAFLREQVQACELLILTGGISRGKFDFVPEALQELGIAPMVTHLRQRPGKPFWFGQSEQCSVFGLPGNPVSAFLGGLRYVLPWLRAGLGLPPHSPLYARLRQTVPTPRQATYFLPVRVRTDETGTAWATFQADQGSGDLANLARIDGFLEIPAEQPEATADAAYPYWAFRDQP